MPAMDAMRDRAPAECPSCGEFFDPLDESIQISVTEEGESRVSCPSCGASFHLPAEEDLGDLEDEEF
jgi:C4-type Zn-finger protein